MWLSWPKNIFWQFWKALYNTVLIIFYQKLKNFILENVVYIFPKFWIPNFYYDEIILQCFYACNEFLLMKHFLLLNYIKKVSSGNRDSFCTSFFREIFYVIFRFFTPISNTSVSNNKTDVGGLQLIFMFVSRFVSSYLVHNEKEKGFFYEFIERCINLCNFGKLKIRIL